MPCGAFHPWQRALRFLASEHASSPLDHLRCTLPLSHARARGGATTHAGGRREDDARSLQVKSIFLIKWNWNRGGEIFTSIKNKIGL